MRAIDQTVKTFALYGEVQGISCAVDLAGIKTPGFRGGCNFPDCFRV